jgi:UDP-glucose 4-epimerase
MLDGECEAFGLGAVSLRYFNAAGAVRLRAGGHLGERHTPESHLIPIVLQVAGGKRDQLMMYGDDYPTPDGTCVRDYIHVADLAEAHLLALAAIKPGRHEVYNLGNGDGYSVRQVIDAAREVTGRPIPVKLAPRRPGDPAATSPPATRPAASWAGARPARPCPTSSRTRGPSTSPSGNGEFSCCLAGSLLLFLCFCSLVTLHP